jgi:hypothetical protein
LQRKAAVAILMLGKVELKAEKSTLQVELFLLHMMKEYDEEKIIKW